MADDRPLEGLASRLRTLVEPVETAPTMEAVRARRQRYRRRRTFVRSGAAVAVIALVAGGGWILATDDGSDPTQVRTPAPAVDSIQLRGDGLGVLDFGASAQEVLDVLTPVLGSPTADPFLVGITTPGATGCVQHAERLFRWPHFVVGIDDDSSGPRLVAWAYSEFAFVGVDYADDAAVTATPDGTATLLTAGVGCQG